MSAEKFFEDANTFADSEAKAYALWIDNNRNGHVDYEHRCTNMCQFEQIDASRFPFAFVCLFSGQLHLCGSACDRAKPAGASGFVCGLTSVVLNGRYQSSTASSSQGTNIANTNQRNKRKRQHQQKAKKKVSARGPSASFLKKTSKTTKRKTKRKRSINRRIGTSQQERMIVSRTIQLFLFYRGHIAEKGKEDALSVCTTAINHYLRRVNEREEIAQVPHMVAVAFQAMPRSEGRQPLVPQADNVFVQKAVEFLVEFVCRAFAHFKSVQTSITRWLQKPQSLRTIQVNQGHIDNHSSQVNALQFTVQLLLMCCEEVRSIVDNRVLIPCIPFLAVFAPRTNQLRQIFADSSYKTLMNMGWFLELADNLYTHGCLPKDPSFSVQNLWPPPPRANNYRPGRMLLIASTAASSSNRAMEDTRQRTTVRAADIISVPPLTQDYASDLSTRGVNGKRMPVYWCCLVDTDTGIDVVVATTDEVEDLKSKNQVTLLFGTWTCRDKADTVVSKWELAPDAVNNGLVLIQDLRSSTRPDLTVFATDTVKSSFQ